MNFEKHSCAITESHRSPSTSLLLNHTPGFFDIKQQTTAGNTKRNKTNREKQWTGANQIRGRSTQRQGREPTQITYTNPFRIVKQTPLQVS